MKDSSKDLNTEKQGAKYNTTDEKTKKKGKTPAVMGDNVNSDDINNKKDKQEKKLLNLKQQLAELEEMNEEYCQRLLRLQADFDNYRKRVAREREGIYGRVTGEIILDFLSILDNMERASLSAKERDNSENNDSLREGIDMIINQFKGVLKKYDVKDITAKGAKFDPNIHYAVMREKDVNTEAGTILEEIQKGYMIKNRVLRPSMVKVALK